AMVPNTAIAFAKLDLDPSVDQKLQAVQFLRHFPQLRGTVTEGGDLRRSLFDSIVENDPKLKRLNFDSDLKPWLGQRMAVAVVPGVDMGKPDTIAVLQVSDEKKAADGLRKLLHAGGDDKTGL